MMDERRKSPSKEAKAQRGSKQLKVTQTRSSSEGVITTRRGDQQKEVFVGVYALKSNLMACHK